jgi:hypothetical protein
MLTMAQLGTSGILAGGIMGVRRATGVSLPTPLVNLAMSESSGIALTDSSGNGNHATLLPNDGIAWTGGTLGVAGQYGTAASFNGTNGYASIPGPALSTVGTIAFWAAWSAGPVLIRDTSASTPGWLIYGTTVLMARINGVLLTTAAAIASVRNGTWRHFAMVKDGGNASLYLDGVNVASVGSVPNTSSALPWRVCRNGTGGSASDYATALIDNVRIYNVALTPEQIIADMNRGNL